MTPKQSKNSGRASWVADSVHSRITQENGMPVVVRLSFT